MSCVRTGLEMLTAKPLKSISSDRLGLLCNQASVDEKFNHAAFIIDRMFPGKLKALFSPQHGFFGDKQDNMIESNDIIEPVFNIPVFSLYGKIRKPDKKMFDHIDTLIIDIQDVGTRVYTFIYTISYCMEAAKEFGKRIVVLDRPNPVNGITVEGNCLSGDFSSFVGRYPIPMRHGLTVAELALLFNSYFKIGCDIEVVPMGGWTRNMFYNNTGLSWVAPSPNLPTPLSAMVYPGQVLWEGTNVSEGRGTAMPFEIFGAPFIETEKILFCPVSSIDEKFLPGAVLRKIVFEPTSNKWSGSMCKGFQIHITEPEKYKPYLSSLKLLQAVIFHHKEDFKWMQPPYEYEFEKLPIDLITGDENIRLSLENFYNLDEVEDSWNNEINEFKEISRNFYLY